MVAGCASPDLRSALQAPDTQRVRACSDRHGPTPNLPGPPPSARVTDLRRAPPTSAGPFCSRTVMSRCPYNGPCRALKPWGPPLTPYSHRTCQTRQRGPARAGTAGAPWRFRGSSSAGPAVYHSPEGPGTGSGTPPELPVGEPEPGSVVSDAVKAGLRDLAAGHDAPQMPLVPVCLVGRSAVRAADRDDAGADHFAVVEVVMDGRVHRRHPPVVRAGTADGDTLRRAPLARARRSSWCMYGSCGRGAGLGSGSRAQTGCHPAVYRFGVSGCQSLST